MITGKIQRLLLTAIVTGMVAAGCAPPPSRRIEPPPGAAMKAEPVEREQPVAPAVTVEHARAFVERTEEALLEHWIAAERAAWVKQTHITHDTAIIAARAHEKLMGLVSDTAKEALRYEQLALPDDLRRKLELLKLSLSLPAPDDPDQRAELARIATEMDSLYGKGKVCSERLALAFGKLDRKHRAPADHCLSLGQLSEILASSRDADLLLEAWQGWRLISRPMKPLFSRYVALGNQGARSLGFADLGALWRSRYDMPPAAFEQEIDRLWDELRPLYEQLHCFVRARLQRRYGADRVPSDGPIPAHLLGNMWAQDWLNIKELLLPEPRAGRVDLDRELRRRKVDVKEMVRMAERFFVSLGMDRLPATFWERSMLLRPRDREVVCHASAWNVDFDQDLRIKMCIKVSGEDFATIHHELGHNYYQYYYRHQPPLFRDSASDAFHEGIGDTISLSVTPSYLVKIGLLRREPGGQLNALMERALEKVAFLPFGVLIDKWRWLVFSGRVTPDNYNRAWWDLRRRYQGIAPPTERSEQDFDPGAKYHVPANVPYARYFLAHVLQFQFHRALCRIAGHQGPLHTCSNHGNQQAGERLRRMLEMGLSRPWPEALRVLSGETRIDVSALLSYFEPLRSWLEQQNVGLKCGW